MKVELFDAIKELQNSYESLIDEIATAIKLRKGIDIGTNESFRSLELVPEKRSEVFSSISIDLSDFPNDFSEKMKKIGETAGGKLKESATHFSDYVEMVRRLKKQTFSDDEDMISFIREELNKTITNLMKGIVLSLPEKSVDTDEDGNLFII